MIANCKNVDVVYDVDLRRCYAQNILVLYKD